MTQTYTAHDVQAIPVGRLFADPTERYSVPLYQRTRPARPRPRSTSSGTSSSHRLSIRTTRST